MGTKLGRTGIAVLLAILVMFSVSRAQSPASSFMPLMMQAMGRMDKGMSATPSGDPDRDFVAMMIPHHQGAIDMAKLELQFGKDSVLRRLAEGIIVEQSQEIDAMQRQLQQLSAASKAP